MRRQHRRDNNDEDDTLRDGQRLRVPLMLMDGLDPTQRAVAREGLRVTDSSGGTRGLHRPGFRIAATDARKRTTHYDPKGRMKGYSETEMTEEDEEEQASDAMRDAAYRDYDRSMCNAWRSDAPEHCAEADSRQTAQDMDEVYDSYDAELAQAWRRA